MVTDRTLDKAGAASGAAAAMFSGLDLLRGMLGVGNTNNMSGQLGQFIRNGGAKIIEQQMPHLFGLGFTDNALGLNIQQKAEKVRPGSRAKLLALSQAMTDYERYFFWMTVTSIKIRETATKKQANGVKPKPDEEKGFDGEIVYQPVTEAELDERVQSLLYIVKLFDENDGDARKTIDDMYTLRVVEHSLLVRTWGSFCKVFKAKVLDPNDAASVKELLNSTKLEERLKSHNDKLEQEYGVKNDQSDHPSIFVWSLERMLGGSYKTRLRDVWELTFIRKLGRVFFRGIKFLRSIVNRKPESTTHKRVAPTFKGDQ